MKKLIFTILMAMSISVLADSPLVVGGKTVVVDGKPVAIQADWTPADITTEAWYDASDESTITESTNFVSQLDDKSGNNRHLAQAVGASQPVTASRTLYGKNVLDFADGDKLIDDDYPNPASGDLAVFVVAEIDLITHPADSIVSMDLGNDWQFGAQSFTQFDGQLSVQANIGTSVALTNGPYAGPSVYNVNFDFTGVGVFNVFVDGVQRTTSNPYNAKLEPTVELNMFCNRTAVNSPDGACAEMILIEDVTEATRQKIEGYLAWKWGLQADLPIGHPYKDRRPTK